MNGCHYLSHWVTLNYPDVIAGIAAFAGTLPALPPKSPSQPVNVLQIHGTADITVPYTDFLQPQGALFAGAMHTITQWDDFNGASGCVADPAPTLDLDLAVSGIETTVTRYTNCPPGGAVELWTMNGSGHGPSLSAPVFPSAHKLAPRTP